MTDLGPPVLYIAAVAWGLTVANLVGIVDLALEQGLPSSEVRRAD